MNAIYRIDRFARSNPGYATFAAVFLALGTAVPVAALVYYQQSLPASDTIASHPAGADPEIREGVSMSHDPSHSNAIVAVSNDKLRSLDLRCEPVTCGQWPRELSVTGRLELNESKVAHVSALVSGVVRDISVEIGQDVKAGDVLAYVDSREAGEAKLQYAQNQLDVEFAEESHEWYTTIRENTLALLEALKSGKEIEAIEQDFRNRPIGDHRQKLVSALARVNQASADHERVRGLAEEDVVPEKEVLRAKAEHESATASYQAFLEQIRFDSHRQQLLAQQRLKQAQTALAVSRSQLFILGFSAADIASMDPIAEGERVAYFPVRAPFDGTVIARDAVLSRHVDAQSELVEIADLSTVWLRADIFEKDLGFVHGLEGKTVSFSTASYPEQKFSAKIFSVGNVVDDETRAARLLAVVDNPQRLLKPGMFVQIDMNSGSDSVVLLVPAAAIQRHDGATFLFVRRQDDQFERRDVQIGRSTASSVEITNGVNAGEPVVVTGGFALKSEMLSDLMVEE